MDRHPLEWRIGATLVVVATLLAACGGGDDGETTSASEPADSASALTIGYSAWPGWFPLAVAEEQGFFADAGLDVDLQYFVDYTTSLDALVAGRLDVNAETLNDTIFAVASGADQKAVVVNDNSTGNDQVICDGSISSVEDLAGKTVAAEVGVVDHFLLLQGLAEAGMSEDDIEFRGVKTDAAAASFAAGQFDCVAVFAPFTLQALERPGSTVLFSSADFPGVIPDLLVASGEASEDEAAMAALVEAWYATLDWIDENPDAAMEVMATKAGVSVEDYRDFAEGTTIFSAEEALEAFEDRPDDPTSLPEMARRTSSFLVESGLAEDEADVSEIFVPSFTETYVEDAR